MKGESVSYNDTVLSNFDMVADLRCFDNTVRADMDMITNLHRIVVKVASIGLVRWSTGYQNNSIRGDVLQTRL